MCLETFIESQEHQTSDPDPVDKLVTPLADELSLEKY